MPDRGADVTRVHLVRHGQVHNPKRMVYGRLPGWRLSAKGRAQAEAVAHALAARPVAALYSSPLQRARETAAIIGETLGLSVRVRDDLTESALAERWEGMPWPQVWLAHRREWQTYRKHPLDLDASEPLARLAERMTHAVRELARTHRGEEIVLVSHGDPIKAAVLALTGGDLGRIHDQRLTTGGSVVLDVAPDGTATVVPRDG